MRRIVLVFFALSVHSWSQPAQQQVQQPQVQTQPTNPWVEVVKTIGPVMATLFGTLFGIRLTNKKNEKENAANRAHQLNIERIKDEIAAQAKSRDNRWAFRKEIYVRVVNAVTDLQHGYDALQEYHRQATSADDASIMSGAKRLQQLGPELVSRTHEFFMSANLAPLATADELIAPIEGLREEIFNSGDPLSPEFQKIVREKRQKLQVLIEQIQKAGRKDLWEIPAPRAAL